MKAILIVLDTLRRDFLRCCGNPWIRTPAFDAFAKESAVFDDYRIVSFPTVPARRDIATGRFSFPWKGWEPLSGEHPILADVLTKRGVVTQLIADTSPMFRDGYGFDRGFQGFWALRGQEDDSLNTDPDPPEMPAPNEKLRERPATFLDQCRRNLKYRLPLERDQFAPKIFSAAEEWLERNRTHKDFFLWVDSFSPHEPWDQPFPYDSMYDPGYKGDKLVSPRYGLAHWITAREKKNLVALYGGMVTFVDKWIGRLFEKVKSLGLWDETMIIVTSDHGFNFGEHNVVGKIGGTLYDEETRVPLIIHDPRARKAGMRMKGFAQPPDLMPTLLDYFRIPKPPSVHGESLLPRLRRARDPGPARPFALSTQRGHPFTWAEGRHTYVRWPRDPARLKKLYDSRAPGDKSICGRFKDELYDIHSDPGQEKCLHARRPDLARKFDANVRNFIEGLDAPADFRALYWPQASAAQERKNA
ncbi:MAG: sulfatase [Planctomycetota bacterium]